LGSHSNKQAAAQAAPLAAAWQQQQQGLIQLQQYK
jgi:hypothetical protein